jgi:uncharacterized protein (DUF58 family)
VLDYTTAGDPRGSDDAEKRLSRLATWVLAAERSGLVFGLKLPGLALAAASGEAQRRDALTALALWQPHRAGGGNGGKGGNSNRNHRNQAGD